MATKKKLAKKKTVYKKNTPFIKKYESDIRLLLVPVILLVIFLILQIVVHAIQRETNQVRVANESAGVPVESYTFFSRQIAPPISAESSIILDRDSRNVLYEKNSHVRFSMASTTKIMTALTAIDHFKPDDILTAYTSNVEGVNVGVEVGDQLYFKDALYALLLPSGNDIAFMIAQNYPGGQDAFVQKMNEKAQALHLTNTHYADPAGLNDDGNYTTATDLAQLAAEVTYKKEIADVTATKSKIISTVGGTKTFVLTNLNRLLGYYGVTGIKTGHTEGAGDVLITSVVAHTHTYIVIVMRSQDRFADTEILLSYLTSDVSTFIPKVTP